MKIYYVMSVFLMCCMGGKKNRKNTGIYFGFRYFNDFGIHLFRFYNGFGTHLFWYDIGFGIALLT